MKGRVMKGKRMDGRVMDQKQRQRAIEMALTQIERQFGKGSIMKLGDRSRMDIPVISSGSISLDSALGIGGFPRGRVIEIYGPESSGKTTIALHVIAEAQKAGGTAAFIDAEHAMDPRYASNLGVKVDDLLVSQPDFGEQALEIAEVLVRSGALDVVVVDSVAALVPRAELEGEMGDPHMGLQARLMSQALRKLTAIVSKSRTSLVFINQVRQKIGVMFGNPETTTGGRALKFYSSIRLEIRRIAAIKEGRSERREPDPGQGREEQVGASVPASRVRHRFRFGNLQGRGASGPRRGPGGRPEERRLVLIRTGTSRAGPRERQAVPQRQPGGVSRDRAQGQDQAGHHQASEKGGVRREIGGGTSLSPSSSPPHAAPNTVAAEGDGC